VKDFPSATTFPENDAAQRANASTAEKTFFSWLKELIDN
jgi:hypothetical protein